MPPPLPWSFHYIGGRHSWRQGGSLMCMREDLIWIRRSPTLYDHIDILNKVDSNIHPILELLNQISFMWVYLDELIELYKKTISILIQENKTIKKNNAAGAVPPVGLHWLRHCTWWSLLVLSVFWLFVLHFQLYIHGRTTRKSVTNENPYRLRDFSSQMVRVTKN